MTPVFTEEELREGSLRSVDAIFEALARGDREAAAAFGKRLRREVLSMRQNYDGWEETLLAWVRRESGDEDVQAALAEMHEAAPAQLSFLYEEHESGETPEDAGERWRRLARGLGSALEQADDAAVRALAQQLHTEGLLYHDRGMTRVSALLSMIGRRFGTDRLEAAYAEAMSADLLGDASFRERAEALMHFTRVHLQPFRVVEDDEKLTFHCAVCPSGGRLIQAGHYEEKSEASPNGGGLHVEGPRWLTYGRDTLPVYCAHEPIMERASIQKTGVPLFIVDPSDDLGRVPCKTYLYKNPEQIPEHFYTRLGLEKPAHARKP